MTHEERIEVEGVLGEQHAACDIIVKALQKERAKLRAEVERLKDDRDLLTGQLQQARKHVSDADLQVSDLTSRLCHALCDCGPAYTPEASAHRKDCRFALAVAQKRNREACPSCHFLPEDCGCGDRRP